jgi:glucoamylase
MDKNGLDLVRQSRSRQRAFGGPGLRPAWSSGAKEAVGTAYSVASRVWFTLADGILTEVFYPTIDRPQIRDFQFLISDGESFFHEEKRDMRTAMEAIGDHTLGYRIIKEDRGGRYRLVKQIICDPHQPCVLIRARIEPAPEWKDKLHLYALLNPHLGGQGSNNSARQLTASGAPILLCWQDRIHLAMGANARLIKSSCGYVGSSDGWQDLNDNFRLDWEFESAEEGNVAVIAEIDIASKNEFTVALAFGDGKHAAVSTLLQALSTPFDRQLARFAEQWHRVCCNILDLDLLSGDGGHLYRLSHNILLAHEDKTFAGAFIASASIPWGEAKGDEDLGGYHLVWTRDMVNTATALLACGNSESPCRALVYLASSQRPDGGFPQNFWIDGTPYWSGIQLDEVAYPVILAWRLWKAGMLADFDPYPMVKSAAAYLIREGPVTQQERWEENSGYSPSTLAVAIAALVCAADFARSRREEHTATFIEEYADFLESHIERWTVTNQGTLVKGISEHYIRIHPVAIGDNSLDEDPNSGIVTIANHPPGDSSEYPAKEIIDAGFLELVRYGIRRPDDRLIERSLRVVDSVLKIESPAGPCWRRYNHDGYGQRSDGSSYSGWGTGRAWPLLTGERGHYELAAGRSPKPYILAMEAFASKGGMLPEQIWDAHDLPGAGMFLGRPTGSAMPLAWAHAEYIKLLRSMADGKPFDFIPLVGERYLENHGRKDLEIWKPNRQVRRVAVGHRLRIQAPRPFLLHWSCDQWQTVEDTESQDSGIDIHFVDLPVESRAHSIVFTFLRRNNLMWEGQDYEVEIPAVEEREVNPASAAALVWSH